MYCTVGVLIRVLTRAITTAVCEDDARLDIRTAGFWGTRHQHAFFDVRVSNSLAPSNKSSSLSATYRRPGMNKRSAEHMRKELGRLSMAALPLWCSQLRVEWGKLLLLLTSIWPTFYLPDVTPLTL